VSVGQLLQLLAVLQVRVLLDPGSDKARSAPRARAPEW